ncbi:hypothetical protein [Streptomyces avermitilis]|uniref:hypothetical protein n=1 Tax=Streptomyces avermitilis TaxID=33903 RepID=UPI00367C0BAA
MRDGDKVLAICTGTGPSTAVLCDRLEDEHLFSVEYDPGLAAAAADHVHAGADEAVLAYVASQPREVRADVR